jgi:predicted PhzF superfamily epimerase YddE/YHI9
LAGHPTLATAHVIYNHLGYKGDEITFFSKGGELKVKKNNDLFQLDFPASDIKKVSPPDVLIRGLGATPMGVFKERDYLAVFDKEKEIRSLKPDFPVLTELDILGIMVTAEGDHSDFVSRFFAPRAGINEDPVTGSAHTMLIPFWAKRLNKKTLYARQVSERGGELFCEYHGDRVFIGGRAITYLIGEIEV